MKHQQFETVDQMMASVRFEPSIVDELMGARGLLLRAFIKHDDEGQESVILTFAPDIPREGASHAAKGLVVISKGIGSRCALGTDGAPPGRVGSFALDGERAAVWASGLPPGWSDPRPASVSWVCRDGERCRLEGADLTRAELRDLATAISELPGG